MRLGTRIFLSIFSAPWEYEFDTAPLCTSRQHIENNKRRLPKFTLECVRSKEKKVGTRGLEASSATNAGNDHRIIHDVDAAKQSPSEAAS
jgi:hypothetical protein